jgi:hypothetical protein
MTKRYAKRGNTIKKRNRARIKLLRKKQKERFIRNKKADAFIVFLFISGISLLVWEIEIYRATIIDWKIPTLICLIPPLLLVPLFFNKLNEIDPTIYSYSNYKVVHYFLHYILHLGIGGAILCFLFMATNFYLADNQITDKKFEIIEKGQFNSKRKENWIRIDYEGKEKELVFPKSYKKAVENAKFVSFEIQKGFLGFEIIKNKTLE